MKKNINLLKIFLLSLIAGYVSTILGVLLLALVLLQFQVTEDVLDIGVMMIYIMASFLAGFCMGKGMGQRRFLWGFFVGCGYDLGMLILAAAVNRQIYGEAGQILICFFVCGGSGMLGGMTAGIR